MPDQYQLQLREEHSFCFHYWKNKIIILKQAAVSEYTKTMWNYNPHNIYLFQVNNGNTLKMCEICSKLTIKTPERRH